MAIATAQNFINQDNWDDELRYNETADHVIAGKLITTTMVVNEFEAYTFKNEDNFRQELKRKLVAGLANYMVSNGLVETTFESDPRTNNLTIRARCFITPNGDVKILRLKK